MALALLLLVVLAGADADGTSCSHRAERLLRRMTLAEKGPQLYHDAPAIPRLHVPAFNFWSEGCHGYTSLQQPGGTMFPTPLALGATFNTHLMLKISTAISDEMRAYYNEAIAAGEGPMALNDFEPNINLLRDPRWGRALEVYGEDPLLMSRLVVAFVRGLQDRRRHQVKVMATCKHFAAYSLEASDGWTRHNFDARVDARDLAESYLPAFEACVREGEAGSVMCSYNRLNGVPACANHDLLDTTLRRHWGFKGFVVSDCGAVSDIADGHKVAAGILQAVAQSTKAGCDLNCDGAAFNITDSVLGGHMRESDVDTVLKRVLEARCVLGILSDRHSDREVTPWDDLKFNVVGSRKHLALARTAAAQSMVLLVNRPVSAWGWRRALPLDPQMFLHPSYGQAAMPGSGSSTSSTSSTSSSSSTSSGTHTASTSGTSDIEDATNSSSSSSSRSSGRGSGEGKGAAGPAAWRLVVMGHLADSREHMLGNYYGLPSGKGPVITPLQAIQELLAGTLPPVYPPTKQSRETPPASRPAGGHPSSHSTSSSSSPSSSSSSSSSSSAAAPRAKCVARPKGLGGGRSWCRAVAPGAEQGPQAVGAVPNRGCRGGAQAEAAAGVEVVCEAGAEEEAVIFTEALGSPWPQYLDGLNYWVTNLMTRDDVAAGVVFVGGSSLNPMNGQDGLQRVQTENEGLDRFSLRLTGAQEQLVQAASRGGKPLVVVLMAGGPLDISPLLALPNVVAVLNAWYPGQQGGEAIADVLFGRVSPSGRLPVTTYFENYTQQASMSNMDMRPWPGRTYRYLQVPSLFPFGHGLSYVRWRYSRLQLRPCRHAADPQPPHSLYGPPLDPDRHLTGQAGGEEAGTSPDLTGGGEGGWGWGAGPGREEGKGGGGGAGPEECLRVVRVTLSHEGYHTPLTAHTSSSTSRVRRGLAGIGVGDQTTASAAAAAAAAAGIGAGVGPLDIVPDAGPSWGGSSSGVGVGRGQAGWEGEGVAEGVAAGSSSSRRKLSVHSEAAGAKLLSRDASSSSSSSGSSGSSSSSGGGGSSSFQPGPPLSRLHPCLVTNSMNSGKEEGEGEWRGDEEVVLAFVERERRSFGPDPPPARQLLAFSRVSLLPGQTCFVELPLPRRQFMSADVDGVMRVVPGKVEVRVGPLALPLHLKAT